MTQTTQTLKHAKGVLNAHVVKDFQSNVGPELRMELLLAVRTVRMELTVTTMTDQTVSHVTDVAIGLP